MSVIDQKPTETIETVTFNLYRDIHKGIRAELFGVTQAAGNIDPADRSARAALADRVANAGDDPRGARRERGPRGPAPDRDVPARRRRSHRS